MRDAINDAAQADNIVILEDNSADNHDKNVILSENTIILAAGDTYSLIDMDKLEEAVERSGMSYQSISDKADISISSIYKFFSRASKNPTFYNVLMIFKAVGASVDDICGITPKRPPEPADQLREKIIRMEDTIENLQYRLEVKDKRIADLERQKSDAESLRDRYKTYFTEEIEKERTRYANEIEKLNRRSSVRFGCAIALAALAIFMFSLYLCADMILSGDYALLRQLFSK